MFSSRASAPDAWICEEKVVYELTVNCLLSSDKKGQPIVDGFDFGKLPYNMAHLLSASEQISEATGNRFAEWAKGDKKRASAPAEDDSPGAYDDTGGGVDEPLPPPAFSSAAELLRAIEAAPDMAELAMLDKAFQRDSEKMQEKTQRRLGDAIQKRMHDLR